MNSDLRLAELIKWMDAHLSRGEVRSSGEQNGVFASLVKQSVSAGLDVIELIRESLPILEELQRTVRQTRERWVAVGLRVAGILLLVAVARIFMLADVSDESFLSWIFLDRVCGGCAIAAAVLFGCWVRGFYDRSSWSEERDKRLFTWLGDYLVLRDWGGSVAELRERLRETRVGELMNGIDGQVSRKRLYLGVLTHEIDEFKRLIPKLAYISILFEWGTFFCAALGFVMIPLLAWFDTATGA